MNCCPYRVVQPFSFLLLLIAAVSLLSQGCVPKIKIEPNDRLVQELGIDEAQRRLQQTVLHAIKPHVVKVEVTPDRLVYDYQYGIHVLQKRLFFTNAVRVDAYTNNAVFVHSSTNQIIVQLFFGNAEDARLARDLILSFRARYNSDSGPGVPRVEFKPEENIIEKLGVEEALSHFEQTMLHAIRPQVIDATVSEDMFEYHYRLQDSQFMTTRVFFANSAKIELYENNAVYVRTDANDLIAQLRFGNREDAKLFAHLVYSFHDLYMRQRFQKGIKKVNAEERVRQTPSMYQPFLEAVVVVRGSSGVGTGFFITRAGHILTNHHVIKHDEAVSITLRNGSVLVGKVLAADPARDLALLSVPGENYRWLVLGNFEDTSVGKNVVAIGAPEGLSWSVSKGVISGFRQLSNIFEPGRYALNLNSNLALVQTDASINHGNSGGPLVDLNTGRVVGINTFIYPKDSTEGLSFAVAADEAKTAFQKYLIQQ